MLDFKVKLLPSVEKCFLDDDIDKKTELTRISMLKNERLSFQMAFVLGDDERVHAPRFATLSVEGTLKDKLTMARIMSVPVAVPTYETVKDENYLRREPGLYPDLLVPQSFDMPLIATKRLVSSYLFTLCDESGIEAGKYSLTFTAECDGEARSASLEITVIDAMLPDEELIHTQWFHNDCIATYYGCEVFSDRHFELIGNYMEAARRCGVNMILTPVLTPPLDTEVGGERPTAQLVDVAVNGGKYSFSYEKLDRYIALAKEKGMKYFEISHLFSQWGAKYAPKVMATVDGEYRRIFGWDTEGTGEKYRTFIREFLTELLSHLKALGVDKNCFFHISDEPSLDNLEGYMKAKENVADILEGYVIMDALSKVEFYKNGAIDHPVPANDHIEPFIEAKVRELWTYYCCGQTDEVSNRFLAMPGQRTRIIGAQMFKYNIAGFLHWGFNYWNSRRSYYPIDPYLDTCGDYSYPAGDAFSVYPGADGKARYSLHAVHFYEGLQDIRALRLLEEKIGHDAAVSLMEKDCDEPMTFKSYPRDTEYVLGMRERINKAISESV